MTFSVYGEMLIVGELLLGTPCRVISKGRSPGGKLTGNLTTMYEASRPATPVTVPTLSTVSGNPAAWTVSTDGSGWLIPRLVVNRITRV